MNENKTSATILNQVLFIKARKQRFCISVITKYTFHFKAKLCPFLKIILASEILRSKNILHMEFTRIRMNTNVNKRIRTQTDVYVRLHPYTNPSSNL